MPILLSAGQILTFSIQAIDGEIGHIEDFYFDDKKWTVRYVVVDTGSWLVGRKVLLSPLAFSSIDPEKKTAVSRFNKDEIKKSPAIDTQKPVSRQEEIRINAHYGHEPYWEASGSGSVSDKSAGDPHLRSVKEVGGYRVEGKDGEIGHISDFLITGVDWAIKYLIIDTRHWIPAEEVLLSPLWVQSMDWVRSRIHMNILKSDIKDCPPYDPAKVVTGEYEEKLLDHYRRSRER